MTRVTLDVRKKERKEIQKCFPTKISNQTRDGAERKFVPAACTAAAASVCCLHRVHICCTLPCLRPWCTAMPKFDPLTAMAVCAP